MKLFIEIVDESVREHYQNWISHHKGDAGLDIIFPQTTTIKPGQTQLVPLGIKCWSPEKKSYFMFPRSSIYKTPLLLANSVGIIDAGYTGEIKAPLYNRNTDYTMNLLTLAFVVLWNLPIVMWFSIGAILWFVYTNYYLITKTMMEEFIKPTSYTIAKSTSYIQLCAANLEPIEIEVVDKLPRDQQSWRWRGRIRVANSSLGTRGEEGFGSTDKSI